MTTPSIQSLLSLEAPQRKHQHKVNDLQPLPLPLDSPQSYLAVVFMILLNSMTTRQTTIITESKEIANNAEEQNELNKIEGEMHFAELPPKAKNSTIQEVQIYNQEIAAARASVMNMIITARQIGQVAMAQASTNVDILQENTASDTRVLRILNTVFQAIIKMGSPS